jgi:aspartate/methionine/tyrosine aminotransferase
MKNTPINYDVVEAKVKENHLTNVGKSSIREIKKLVDDVEAETGEKYVRMEMGIPGLPAVQIGIDAEIEAHRKGVASIYPDIHGIPPLKKEMSRFIKMFLDVDVDPTGCLPTVGSLQGCFAAFMTVNRMFEGRDTTLFIDPGFPVHKQQLNVLGYKWETCLLYSNPNNPSWICFTETELQIIAELADKYDVVVLEDLAYFAMDFRKNLSKPGEPPYQATVAKYTDNYILFVSSSKAFSYAGQRVGMMVISDGLFKRKLPDLKRFYTLDLFGYAMIFGTLYSLSAGVTHTAQYALAAMLKAANDGTFDFVEVVKEYGAKAKIMKKLFTDNGFEIVYDMDEDEPIADGFYFTYSYPGFSGADLVHEMIFYGISAISLAITGSKRLEGVRACVSLVQREQFPALEARLKKFHEDHPIT